MKIAHSQLRNLIREELRIFESRVDSGNLYQFDDGVYFGLSPVTVEKEGDEWSIQFEGDLGEFGKVPVKMIGPIDWLASGIEPGSTPGDRSHEFLESEDFPFEKFIPYEDWKREFPGGASHIIEDRPRLFRKYVERFHREEWFLDRIRMNLGQGWYLIRDVKKGIQLTILRIERYLNSKRVQNIISQEREKFNRKLSDFFSIGELVIVDYDVMGGMTWGGHYSPSSRGITIGIYSNSRRGIVEITYHEFLHHWQSIFDEPASFDWTFSGLEREESEGNEADDKDYEETFQHISSRSNSSQNRLQRLLNMSKVLRLPDQFDRNTVREAMRKESSFFKTLPDLHSPDSYFTRKAFYQFQENHFTMALRRLFMILNNMGYDLDVTNSESIQRFKQGLSALLSFRVDSEIYLKNPEVFALPLFLKNTAKNHDLIIQIGRRMVRNTGAEEIESETV